MLSRLIKTIDALTDNIVLSTRAVDGSANATISRRNVAVQIWDMPTDDRDRWVGGFQVQRTADRTDSDSGDATTIRPERITYDEIQDGRVDGSSSLEGSEARVLLPPEVFLHKSSGERRGRISEFVIILSETDNSR